jgi:hypothetical protein
MSEKPVHSRLRRLVDWINLTGAKKIVLARTRYVTPIRPERAEILSRRVIVLGELLKGDAQERGGNRYSASRERKDGNSVIQSSFEKNSKTKEQPVTLGLGDSGPSRSHASKTPVHHRCAGIMCRLEGGSGTAILPDFSAPSLTDGCKPGVGEVGARRQGVPLAAVAQNENGVRCSNSLVRPSAFPE